MNRGRRSVPRRIGYTVHTGSNEKFAAGWDRVFGNQQSAAGKKAAGGKSAGAASRKRSAKTAAAKAGPRAAKAAAKKARSAGAGRRK